MKIVHAAVGRNHTLCLTESGKVYAFGENAQGQLGIGEIAVHTDVHKNYASLNPCHLLMV